jgi:hypothetical protein
MPSDDNQRKVFDFFVQHLETKAPFKRDELESVTDWQGQTFPTYWSKHLRPLVLDVGEKSYRVAEAFRRYATWDQFQQHVTQMRRVTSTDYRHRVYNIVRVYEFFMPLSNEGHLRMALDALFYRDSVLARLRTIPQDELAKHWTTQADTPASDQLLPIGDWISDHFGGYSIYHVAGRFRAMPLMSRADSCNGSPRYLVDETTAVTRFIFPCGDEREADLVAFFFEKLFVQAIIEVVNGEDEIWMVESGYQNCLHTWKVSEG